MAYEWGWTSQNPNASNSQANYSNKPRETLHDDHPDATGIDVRNVQEWEQASDNDSTGQYAESEDPSEGSVPEVERAVYGHDGPTPPINVPIPANGIKGGRTFSTGLQPSTYYDSSSLEKYMNSRRTSISFDPKVKTDDGNQAVLGAAPPKLSIKTRPRGKSLLDEIAAKRDRPVTKAHSETDREEYDPVTGERLDASKEGAKDGRYTLNQPRWPLLQSTVDALAVGSPSKGANRSTSLTSRHTLSPTAETHTPSDPLFTPLTSYSPSRPDWFSPSSSDFPRRFSNRSRSHCSERGSLSRRVSQRATTNSPSPASAFLKKYTSSSPTTSSSPDSEGQEIRDYVLGRQIGFGGFSVIREAFTINGKERLRRAVKIVRHQATGKEEAESESLQAAFEHEIELWRRLSHAHILPLIDIYFTPYATFAFMKLTTGGTLFDLVRTNRAGLPPRLTRRYAGQLASALRYLHEDMHIVHGDLKLENCLLDMSALDAAETGGSLLLCDFGLADYSSASEDSSTSSLYSARRHHSPPGAGHDPRTPATPKSPTIGPSDTSTSLAGSLPYAAPELLEAGQSVSSTKADIWAFGVICFALAMGKLPFMHAFSPMVSAMILRGEWDREGLRARDRDETRSDELATTHGNHVTLDYTKVNGVRTANGFNERGSSSPVGSNNGTLPLDSPSSNPLTTSPTSPTSDPDSSFYLIGVFGLVTNCLVRQPQVRWDISACLGSRWLEVENEAYDDVKVWGSGIGGD